MSKNPSANLCKIAEKSLEESKAQSIIKLDLHNKSSLCDYMLIATGTSSRHVKSIIINIKKVFKKIGFNKIDAEEDENSNWIILDIGDIIIHVFQEESREKYKLEELWHKPKD